MRPINADELKEHKFVGNKFIQIGGRTNGKTLESVNQAYQQGWNDCIDAIIDNAPTVEYPFYAEAYQTGYEEAKKKFERPQGEWYFSCEKGWECNQCHEVVKDMPTCMRKAIYNFCPNCGAKMGKEKKND